MEITTEMIDMEEDKLFETVLDMNEVVRILIQQLKSGEQKISAALLQQSTSALRTLGKLLQALRSQVEYRRERDEAAALMDESGMSPEEKTLLDEWEETEEAGYQSTKSTEEGHTDSAKLLSRWPMKGR